MKKPKAPVEPEEREDSETSSKRTCRELAEGSHIRFAVVGTRLELFGLVNRNTHYSDILCVTLWGCGPTEHKWMLKHLRRVVLVGVGGVRPTFDERQAIALRQRERFGRST